MFAYQSAPGCRLNTRKRIIYLTGGDTYIKYWLTPAFAVGKLLKCIAETHNVRLLRSEKMKTTRRVLTHQASQTTLSSLFPVSTYCASHMCVVLTCWWTSH